MDEVVGDSVDICHEVVEDQVFGENRRPDLNSEARRRSGIGVVEACDKSVDLLDARGWEVTCRSQW